MAVVIETTIGDLTVDLFIEERPRACLNFLKLCKLKYYNYNLFHNVERDFIAQTGDPTGAGDGGESIWGVIEGQHKRYFEAETLPKIKHTALGLLSLVGIGKNLVGSQFFFTLAPDLTSLDGVHCVIGEVVEGHDVLRQLNEAIVDEKFRPYQDIRITHTVILEDPFDDPRGFQIPSRSPSPTPERLKNGRIGADEDINDTEGKTEEEINEMLQEREAKARATILEIVGDLPDAEIAPPENVLFVCKLNPVTTDDDLDIIFSRFGKVKGCEVIRDKYTGDSLQYAFVEFEDKKACENAYFKMDNVLIDDRRIHVDFSQSVAKVKWRGKGRGLVYQDKNEKIDFDNLRGNNRNDKRTNRRENSPQRRNRNDYDKNQKPYRHENRNYDQNYSRRHDYERDRRDNTSRRSTEYSGSRDRENQQQRFQRQYENQDRYKRRDYYAEERSRSHRENEDKSRQRISENYSRKNDHNKTKKHKRTVEKKSHKRNKDVKKSRKRRHRSSSTSSSTSNSSSSSSSTDSVRKRKSKKQKHDSSSSSSSS